MLVRGLMKFEGPGMISFVSTPYNPILAGY
jgi:hypothetical protein